MKKRNKIIIGVLLVLVLALGGVAYMVGDFFVDYAVGRKDVDFEDPLSPTYEKPESEVANELAADIAIETFLSEYEGEDVYMESFDGLTMYGKMFLQNDTDMWIIIAHGYTSSYTHCLDLMVRFYEQGYNVLLPSLRTHGESEGDYISMGYYDGRDVAEWANLIVADNVEAKIVLHGTSMGAATVMMAAGEETLPENVFAVVEDCGYTNAYTMFVEQLEYRYGLPEFPVMTISRMLGKVRTGFDFRDASPIDALANATVPILFIHGDADGFVLPYMQVELFDSYEGEKEMLIIEGADHGAARYVDPDVYYGTMWEFIDRYK